LRGRKRKNFLKKKKKKQTDEKKTQEGSRREHILHTILYKGAAPFPHNKNHHGEKFNRVLSEGREPGEHVRRTVLGHDRDVSVHSVIVFRIIQVFFFFFFFFFFDECCEGLRRCHKSRKNDDKSDDDDENRRRRGFSDDEKVFFDVTETHALAKLLLEPRERAAARAAAKFNPPTSLRVERVPVPSVHQRFTLRR
jgi:hypothetical protein